MLTHAETVAFQGIHCVAVTVQTHISSSTLPYFSVVGLPDKAVNESKERIRAALYSLGLAMPSKRLILNLMPANLPKEGSHYDLPMVLGLLMALEVLPLEVQQYVALGELGLDASIKSVYGTLSAALFASSVKKSLICPESCGGEAVWGGAIEVLAPNHLLQIINHFKGTSLLCSPKPYIQQSTVPLKTFSDIKGQETAKRALIIAAAGQHNVLMSGPPGSGKTMLASCMPALLPPLEPKEALEATMIHSLSQKTSTAQLMRFPPFRNPHHSISMPALVGGGMRAIPGEISLAHGGILFLDELPEFQRPILDALRQSLESGEAVVSRANCHVTYPARFQLIAAMNPCLCGYLGQTNRQCSKAPACGALYKKGLSGPLLDRMDLFVEVPQVSPKNLETMATDTKMPFYVQQVSQARAWQKQRYQGQPFSTNGCASSAFLDDQLSRTLKTLLNRATEKWGLSLRAYYKIIRVARTIADLDKSPSIGTDHLMESLSYRET